MRISTTQTPGGAVYRVYDGGNAWSTHFELLMTLLHEREFKVRVGGVDEDPRTVLTIGPLAGLTDEVFRLHIAQILER